MRILVTGGAGFIGSHLCAKLASSGHEVAALDNYRFNYGAEFPRNFQVDLAYRMEILLAKATHFHSSILEKRRVAQVIEAFEPQRIVHLAAVPLVAYATRHEELASRVMCEGLLNLLEASRDSPSLERFVFVSSSMVYGDFTRDPMPEDAELDPVNVYGGLKLAGEVLVKSYLSRSPVQVTIVRPSCVYGPADFHPRIVRKFCEAALAGEPILLNANNDHLMDFTHVEDATTGLLLATTHPNASGETFNITYGRARHLTELADILSGFTGEVHRDNSPIDDGDRPRRGSLSVDKAKRLIGYEPTIDLETGIASYLEWLEPGSVGNAFLQVR